MEFGKLCFCSRKTVLGYEIGVGFGEKFPTGLFFETLGWGFF